MIVQVRLKQLLKQHNLDRKGVFTRISRETGIPRKVVSRFYHDRCGLLTLNQIGRLSQWLRRQGVTEDLPGALFGECPSGLAQAMAAPGRVRIYVGEYIQRDFAHIPKSWVSRADSEVVARIVQLLSAAPPSITLADSRFPVRFEFVHVPSFRASFNAHPDDDGPDEQTMEEARRIFRLMRSDDSGATNVLIGSQRANLLVELFVAETFGCEPYGGPTPVLPFYLHRTSNGPQPPSCFGGSDRPPGAPELGTRGVYYRRQPLRWQFCPSRPNETDAGIVIVRRVPGSGQIDLAVFGFSALATRAMGDLLHRNPDEFWQPLQRLRNGVEARAYLCRMTLRKNAAVMQPSDKPVVDEAEVYPLLIDDKAGPKRRDAG